MEYIYQAFIWCWFYGFIEFQLNKDVQSWKLLLTFMLGIVGSVVV